MDKAKDKISVRNRGRLPWTGFDTEKNYHLHGPHTSGLAQGSVCARMWLVMPNIIASSTHVTKALGMSVAKQI